MGVRTPVSEPTTSEAFQLGVFATLNNGFESLQVSEFYPVQVLSSSYCSIEYDTDARPLLGVDRNGESSQMLTIRNIGNMPLDASIETTLDADDWDVDLSKTELEGIAPGSDVEIEITVGTNDDTETGIEELSVSCQDTSVKLEISVKNTKSQGGLFGIVSPAVGYSIIGAILLGVGVIAIRIKKSAPKGQSDEGLVALGAHSMPDDGGRMQAVMDSVVGQESMASGDVSAEEIADALAQSIPTLPTPGAPAVVPQGRPPSAVPAGRPPISVPKGRPPAPVPQARPPMVSHQPPTPPVPTGPPLPPGGLPPGWTMQQWQYYGHKWLEQQGQQ